MKISIDANNDTLHINPVDRFGDLLYTDATFTKVKAHQVRQILSEIFNRIDVAGVELEYIDEDKRSSEEW